MLLAIDTSTSWASIALYDGRSVLGELTWHSERRSGDELFPMLERQLSLAGADLADVDRLSVAIGPGSFTGIRVAIAAARGLARARGAQLAGVSTLDVIAYAHALAKTPVCALLPAGRDEWYTATYALREGAWTRISDYAAATLPAICRDLAADTIFTGEFDDAVTAELRELGGRRAVIASPSSRVRRAGHLAELGWTAIATRGAARADELAPLYVKQASVGGSGRATEPLGATRGG